MGSPGQSAPQYKFGVFVADPRSGELRKHGLRVKLQERPFQLLVALVESPGEIVTREELRQRLWPDGTFVDFDHNLSSAVNKLRSALNDSANHPHYIETVGRRGYRFIYPVSATALLANPEVLTVVEAPAQGGRRRGPMLLAGIASALLIAIAIGIWRNIRNSGTDAGSGGIHSIAVLPLKNLSSDPEQEYFSEGLTEELITRLASLEGLRVISRTSVMQYKDSSKPLPVIGKELEVDAVVEGSVLRSGGRVRITAQLIEAAPDRHIWAESYERDERDIIALQNEVARDIAEKIQLNLNPAEQQRLVASNAVGSESYAAYDLYLKGRYFWNKRTEQGLQRAVEYFQQAIAANPGYARAYAGLADSYTMMSGYNIVSPQESIPKARAAALQALQLDEGLAEAHTSLAVIAQNYDWDWKTAEKEYRRAIQLDPAYATAHHWYAECLAFQGRFDEAFAESERARQLDPLSLIIAADNGAILYFSRQYDRAIEKERTVLEIEPDFPRAHLVLQAYAQAGRFAEALEHIRKWREAEDTPWTFAHEAYVDALSGDKAQAQRILAKLQKMIRTQKMDPNPMLLVVNAGLKNKDAFFACLQKAFLNHSNALTSLKVDPIYDPVRDDPRFQQFLHRIGLQ
jgi:TolB-like protein/DNA-binding winged helix-turn-helix (wHTH) protein/Tfp pilus assembly protein PilF